MDLRNAEQINALVARSIETFGRVDILVNNAGAVSFGDVTHWTLKKFDLVMAVNVRAAFLLSRALLSGMRERRSGTVAMISPPVHPAAAMHVISHHAEKMCFGPSSGDIARQTLPAEIMQYRRPQISGP